MKETTRAFTPNIAGREMVMEGADMRAVAAEPSLVASAGAAPARDRSAELVVTLLGVLWIVDQDDCSIPDTAAGMEFTSNDPSLGNLDNFRCTRFGVQCSVGGATPDDMNTPGVKDACTDAPVVTPPRSGWKAGFPGAVTDGRSPTSSPNGPRQAPPTCR